MSQVIYQVRLKVERRVELEFRDWLRDHIDQMLDLNWFQSCEVWAPSESANENESLIVVNYVAKDLDTLNSYFERDAENMRQQGLLKFKDNFTAERSVYNKEYFVSKK